MDAEQGLLFETRGRENARSKPSTYSRARAWSRAWHCRCRHAGLQHHRELAGSLPAVWFRLGCGHHLCPHPQAFLQL
jgi:hypothetical protein